MLFCLLFDRHEQDHCRSCCCCDGLTTVVPPKRFFLLAGVCTLNTQDIFFTFMTCSFSLLCSPFRNANATRKSTPHVQTLCTQARYFSSDAFVCLFEVHCHKKALYFMSNFIVVHECVVVWSLCLHPNRWYFHTTFYLLAPFSVATVKYVFPTFTECPRRPPF